VKEGMNSSDRREKYCEYLSRRGMVNEVNEILQVIRHGLSSLNISLGMPLETLEGNFGKAKERVGDSNAGYLNYDYVRVGYFGSYVDEVAILFDDNPQFKIEIEGLEEVKIINGETTIKEFLHILNYAGICWSSQYRKIHLDYISITIEAASEVLFDLQTGCIMRIALLGRQQFPEEI